MAKRRTLDETRERLLRAGAELLGEHGLSVSLERLTLIDVCRRAGLSTAGSGYKIWSDQEAFRSDVLHHLLLRRSAAAIAAYRADDLVADATDLPSFDELIRTVTGLITEIDEVRYPTYLAVWLAQRTDPDLKAIFATSESEWLDGLAAFLTRTLAAYDREIIPPFDAPTLAVTLSAIVEGLMIRRRSTPELVPEVVTLPTGPGGSAQDWTPFGLGARAILHAWTRPRKT